MLGAAFSGIKNVKVSLKAGASAPTDISKHSKFQATQAVLTLTPPSNELDTGLYLVVFEVETGKNSFNLNSSLKIVDTIKVSDLAYKLTSTSQFPSSLDKQISF